jgi:hypothetical protein
LHIEREDNMRFLGLFEIGKKKAPDGKDVRTPAEQPKGADKPTRFYAYGNSLCLMGQEPWPPVLRDNAHYNRNEIYQHIADSLNVKHRYGFVRKQLETSVAAYKAGNIDKQQLGDDLLHMLQVIQADEKRDEPFFAEHKRMLANYERRYGNYGG